jgi:hypothetical protein
MVKQFTEVIMQLANRRDKLFFHNSILSEFNSQVQLGVMAGVGKMR